MLFCLPAEHKWYIFPFRLYCLCAAWNYNKVVNIFTQQRDLLSLCVSAWKNTGQERKEKEKQLESMENDPMGMAIFLSLFLLPFILLLKPFEFNHFRMSMLLLLLPICLPRYRKKWSSAGSFLSSLSSPSLPSLLFGSSLAKRFRRRVPLTLVILSLSHGNPGNFFFFSDIYI